MNCSILVMRCREQVEQATSCRDQLNRGPTSYVQKATYSVHTKGPPNRVISMSFSHFNLFHVMMSCLDAEHAEHAAQNAFSYRFFRYFFAVFQHSSLTPSWCFTRCHFDESKVKNGTAPAPPKQYRPKTAPKRYLAMEAYWQNNLWSKTSYQKSGVCCFNPKFVNYPHPDSGK